MRCVGIRHLNNPKYYALPSLFSLATHGRLRYSSPCPNRAAAPDNDVTKFLHRSVAHNGGHGALHPHAHAPVHPCYLDWYCERVSARSNFLSAFLCPSLSPPAPPPLCAISLDRSVRRMRPPISTVRSDRLCFDLIASRGILSPLRKHESSICNELSHHLIRARLIVKCMY